MNSAKERLLALFNVDTGNSYLPNQVTFSTPVINDRLDVAANTRTTLTIQSAGGSKIYKLYYDRFNIGANINTVPNPLTVPAGTSSDDIILLLAKKYGWNVRSDELEYGSVVNGQLALSSAKDNLITTGLGVINIAYRASTGSFTELVLADMPLVLFNYSDSTVDGAAINIAGDSLVLSTAPLLDHAGAKATLTPSFVKSSGNASAGNALVNAFTELKPGSRNQDAYSLIWWGINAGAGLYTEDLDEAKVPVVALLPYPATVDAVYATRGHIAATTDAGVTSFMRGGLSADDRNPYCWAIILERTTGNRAHFKVYRNARKVFDSALDTISDNSVWAEIPVADSKLYIGAGGSLNWRAGDQSDIDNTKYSVIDNTALLTEAVTGERLYEYWKSGLTVENFRLSRFYDQLNGKIVVLPDFPANEISSIEWTVLYSGRSIHSVGDSILTLPASQLLDTVPLRGVAVQIISSSGKVYRTSITLPLLGGDWPRYYGRDY